MSNVFHPGEVAVQSRAGFVLPGAPIRDFMPDQHRAFFAALPVLFVAVGDERGAPLATVLPGRPGFIGSPDATTLEIGALPLAGDPARDWLVEGSKIGLLGLDFATRRRNRANGTVARRGETGMRVEVRQSFGNCPKYIVRREPSWVGGEEGVSRVSTVLDGAALQIVRNADTLFVASSGGPGAGMNGGLDMSHRGGPAGFVMVEGNRLTIPDYRGNRYFNTLGNLVLDSRVGLLFMEFTTGSVVQVQGRAEIAWGEAGAESWSVQVERVWFREQVLPWRWGSIG